jgi:hypothetical protein
MQDEEFRENLVVVGLSPKTLSLRQAMASDLLFSKYFFQKRLQHLFQEYFMSYIFLFNDVFPSSYRKTRM